MKEETIKAKEIYNNCLLAIFNVNRGFTLHLNQNQRDQAKRCATVCVDNTIKVLTSFDVICPEARKELKLWNLVRKELSNHLSESLHSR